MNADKIIGIIEAEIEKGGHPRNIAINVFELIEPEFEERFSDGRGYSHLKGREREEAIRESNQRAGGDLYGG